MKTKNAAPEGKGESISEEIALLESNIAEIYAKLEFYEGDNCEIYYRHILYIDLEIFEAQMAKAQARLKAQASSRGYTK